MGKRVRVNDHEKNTSVNEKKRKVDESDRLTELPDDILSSILSHLPLDEAARTSILSSRWRDMWIIRDTLAFHDLPETRGWNHWSSLDPQTQFIDRVDGVLEKHKGPTVNEFTVKSDLLCNSTLSERILNWFYFAIQKRVQRLDLALPSFRYQLRSRQPRYHYVRQSYPDEGHSFPSLNFLLSEVEGFSSFVTTLKVLRLQSFNVDGKLLAYLLSNSPVLEHLTVSFSHSLVNLRVEAPSMVSLKYFEIYNCPRIKSIHFDDAPNLECIRFIGSVVTISIKNAPHLINVSMGNYYSRILSNLGHLSNHFSQLEVLTLEVETKKGFEGLYFSNFPIMIHLKQLTLRLKIFCYSLLELNLLTAMPSLYLLHLKVENNTSKMEIYPKLRFCHEPLKLKLVEWDGYRGDRDDLFFVKFLTENCKVLEKVTITKSKRNIDAFRRPDNHNQPSAIERSVMQLLKLAGVQVTMQ